MIAEPIPEIQYTFDFIKMQALKKAIAGLFYNWIDLFFIQRKILIVCRTNPQKEVYQFMDWNATN